MIQQLAQRFRFRTQVRHSVLSRERIFGYRDKSSRKSTKQIISYAPAACLFNWPVRLRSYLPRSVSPAAALSDVGDEMIDDGQVLS